MHVRLLLTTALLLCPAYSRTGPGALPRQLHDYVMTVAKLTDLEYDRLLKGEVVTKHLEANPDFEVAVFGAVWIKGTVARYVSLVQEIEQFEQGLGFPVTQKISSPPKLSDFVRMQLPQKDRTALRDCRIGDCEIKLSQEGIGRLRKEVDWNRSDWQTAANATVQRIAFDYVNEYLQGGNASLATYHDKARPVSVAKEFRSMVDKMTGLNQFMPDMRQYLLGYPRVQLPNSKSFLYWQETRFGLKPTLRINHLVIQEKEQHAVVASKMLYASHYFWTALELRVVMPDPARGPGFWLATVSISRSDGLSGLLGRLIRRKVRNDSEAGVLTVLRTTKSKVEQHAGK